MSHAYIVVIIRDFHIVTVIRNDLVVKGFIDPQLPVQI